MSVPPDRKWQDIFAHCYTLLGCDMSQGIFPPPPVEPSKAWEKVAALLALAKKAHREASDR